jgi:hypothetical protein
VQTNLIGLGLAAIGGASIAVARLARRPTSDRNSASLAADVTPQLNPHSQGSSRPEAKMGDGI